MYFQGTMHLENEALDDYAPIDVLRDFASSFILGFRCWLGGVMPFILSERVDHIYQTHPMIFVPSNACMKYLLAAHTICNILAN